MRDCVFCDIVANRVEFPWQDRHAVAFTPLNPVTPGHTLVVPRLHVEDFSRDARISAATMSLATFIAHEMGGDMNLITSKGPAATQTVYHLHLHLVPRHTDDNLWLPWTNQ